MALPKGFLLTRPRTLLLQPSKGQAVDPSQLIAHLPGATAAPDQVPALDEHLDLAAFFAIRLLRATASLQTQILSVYAPAEDAIDAAARLYRDQDKLRLQLESLMVAIFDCLTRLAVYMSWKDKENSVQGGVGRARSLATELVQVIEGQNLAFLPTRSRHLTFANSSHNDTRPSDELSPDRSHLWMCQTVDSSSIGRSNLSALYYDLQCTSLSIDDSGSSAHAR